jgi:hypothetical protein
VLSWDDNKSKEKKKKLHMYTISCVKIVEFDIITDMKDRVKKEFPLDYQERMKTEKKRRTKLLPLPRRRGFWQGIQHWNTPGAPHNHSLVMVVWAGVMFVVLLLMAVFTIFYITMSFAFSYVWDNFWEVLSYLNQLCDVSWHQFKLRSPEDNPDLPTNLTLVASPFGRALQAFIRLVNGTSLINFANVTTMGVISNGTSSCQLLWLFASSIVYNFVYHLIFGLTLSISVYKLVRYLTIRD